jgi:hypothetical protein
MTKQKTVTINTFHRYVNYWNSYNDEIKLNMIVAIHKAVTWAMIDFTKTIKLYAVYLKDGEKIYTDLSGFKRLMKSIRENKLDITIK